MENMMEPYHEDIDFSFPTIFKGIPEETISHASLLLAS
jgi:hypothetical protein